MPSLPLLLAHSVEPLVHGSIAAMSAPLPMLLLAGDVSCPSMVDKNPLIWMLEVNGFIIDVRHAPREIQEEAFRKGLIPSIPDDTVLTSQAEKEKGAEHGV